jgi:PAS domain S-box-containing protein
MNEHLTNALESLTDGFFMVDRDWRFTYLNAAAETLLGRTRSTLLDKSIWAEFPKTANTEFQRHYEQALKESRTVEFETFHASLNYWLHVKVYPSGQGLTVYFRNVSESRALKESLMNSEKRYRMLFECSSDAIMETLADGAVLRANPAACAMFGMTEEVCSAGRPKLVAPEDTRLHIRLQERLQNPPFNGSATGQLTLVRKDGFRFEAEITSSEYTGVDGIAFQTLTLRDITASLRKTQRMEQLNAQLDERVRRRTELLEKANSELRGFAHSLAHDLRTPITTIGGFSGKLEKQLANTADEHTRRLVSRIRAAANQMAEYTDALLALASLSQVELQITQLDLSAIARSVLTSLQAQEPQRTLQAHIQTGLHAKGDARLLRSVLEKLLGNAWKFTNRRTVSVISFTAQTTLQGETWYCIKDNGAGFNPAYGDKLFASFQRLHSPTEFAGMGIGLANVWRIIGRHDGRVWAESVEGEGSEFFFTLGSATGQLAQ